MKAVTVHTKPILIICIVLLLSFGSNTTVAQTPILDSDGNETHLINMNPHPEAEPWIAGDLDLGSFEKEVSLLPPMDIPNLNPEIIARDLPSKCDNTTNQEFRPIFNQAGSSCAQASSVSYVFTYEINLLRMVSSNQTENQYPYGYTYNFVNGGSSATGSGPSQGWSIIQENGIPNLPTYGGALEGKMSQTSWPATYDVYYKGMSNRIQSQNSISQTGTPAGLLKLKQYLYNHAGASDKGGLVVFGTDVKDWEVTKKIASGAEAGKILVTKFGSGGGHLMTFAGYNDSVKYDFNGDGKFTNDIETSGDSVITMKDWEIGALLLVNSWGTKFGDQGKAWVPYRFLAIPLAEGGISTNGNTSVSGIKVVKEYTPKFVYKITVSHTKRNGLVLQPGIAVDVNAAAPSKTASFGKAFNKAGGSFPMEGKGGKETIEIGLDVTKLAQQASGKQAKFFLTAKSDSGVGKIVDFTLMDYTKSPVKEIKCSETNVTIGASTVLSIVTDVPTAIALPFEPKSTLQASLQSEICCRLQKNERGINLTLKNPGTFRVSVLDLRGKTVYWFTTNTSQTVYALPHALASAKVAILSLTNGKTTYSQKLFIY